jgi:nicotinic acid mononucleotide adenylyltransferase
VFKRENNFSPLEYNYLKDKGYDFDFEDLPFEDISSTELRKRIKENENTENLINEKVKEYILKNGLYEN